VTSHEQLWAPWRLAYIAGEAGRPAELPQSGDQQLQLLPGADPSCFICRDVAESADRQNLVIERTELSIVILNRFPYNNGHLLVAPRAHRGRIDELDDLQLVDLQRLISSYVRRLERLLNAEGFNIGLNLGKVAGAGLPGHLHWHIVPRWHGDTNFMPSLAGIRVIPQSLDALWQILHDAREPHEPAPG
jgi:ATP adenylyltransferase